METKVEKAKQKDKEIKKRIRKKENQRTSLGGPMFE